MSEDSRTPWGELDFEIIDDLVAWRAPDTIGNYNV
jgi:hypothetical protein